MKKVLYKGKDIDVCPSCNSTTLFFNGEYAECLNCGSKFQVENYSHSTNNYQVKDCAPDVRINKMRKV